MCVALPAQVEWVGEQIGVSIPGRVRIGETEQDVDLMLVPGVAVGDHVVVHSGYAISLVSEAEALETARLFDEAS